MAELHYGDETVTTQRGVVVAGTGHRPQKLTRQGRMVAYSEKLYQRLVALAKAELGRIGNVTEVISGMALGWDTALAEAAIQMGIPLTAAVPFLGQESQWPEASQSRYKSLLSQATKTVGIHDGGYSPKAMQARNEWMVDRCEILLALWDGTAGGTGNAVRYLERLQGAGATQELQNAWPRWVKHSGLY